MRNAQRKPGNLLNAEYRYNSSKFKRIGIDRGIGFSRQRQPGKLKVSKTPNSFFISLNYYTHQTYKLPGFRFFITHFALCIPHSIITLLPHQAYESLSFFWDSVRAPRNNNEFFLFVNYKQRHRLISVYFFVFLKIKIVCYLCFLYFCA